MRFGRKNVDRRESRCVYGLGHGFNNQEEWLEIVIKNRNGRREEKEMRKAEKMFVVRRSSSLFPRQFQSLSSHLFLSR